MKEIIIPDIHLHVETVNQILDYEKPDRTIFLGDIFDDYDDTLDQVANTANWVRTRMEQHPEDIWLLGNHDLAYAYPCNVSWCPGFNASKLLTIDKILKPAHWSRFKFYHWLDDKWLLSHAGVHLHFATGLKTVQELKDKLAKDNEDAYEALKNDFSHWFYAIGSARGGTSPIGGLLWCDFDCEFTAIPGVNQLVGHTCQCRSIDGCRYPGVYKTSDSLNYCIDTAGQNYAIWDGERMTTKHVSEMKH